MRIHHHSNDGSTREETIPTELFRMETWDDWQAFTNYLYETVPHNRNRCAYIYHDDNTCTGLMLYSSGELNAC